MGVPSITKELADIVRILGEPGAYMKVRFMCESLQEQANAGDTSAREVLSIVLKFRKLVLLANEETISTEPKAGKDTAKK